MDSKQLLSHKGGFKMMKKLVSLALAAAMVLSVSASAFAGEAKSAKQSLPTQTP